MAEKNWESTPRKPCSQFHAPRRFEAGSAPITSLPEWILHRKKSELCIYRSNGLPCLHLSFPLFQNLGLPKTLKTKNMLGGGRGGGGGGGGDGLEAAPAAPPRVAAAPMSRLSQAEGSYSSRRKARKTWKTGESLAQNLVLKWCTQKHAKN